MNTLNTTNAKNKLIINKNSSASTAEDSGQPVKKTITQNKYESHNTN